MGSLPFPQNLSDNGVSPKYDKHDVFDTAYGENLALPSIPFTLGIAVY